MIGISSPKINLNFAEVSITSEEGTNKAGGLSTYHFNIRPTSDLSDHIIVRMFFPEIYDFALLKEKTEDYNSLNPCSINYVEETNYQPKGNFTCIFNEQTNIIDIDGFEEIIPKNATLLIDIAGVLNPLHEMTTDFFHIEIMIKNSNHTVEFDDAIEGVQIMRGEIEEVEIKQILPLNLVPSNSYWFTFSFMPTNPFSSIRIVTRLRSISECHVQNGLKIYDIE